MLNPSKFQTHNILSKCARYYISMYFWTSYVDENLMGVSLYIVVIDISYYFSALLLLHAWSIPTCGIRILYIKIIGAEPDL